MSKFLRRPMHEPNDEPRVKPTEAEVAKAIYGVLNRQYGDFNWPDDAAASVLALFTDQPTVAQIKAEALRYATWLQERAKLIERGES